MLNKEIKDTLKLSVGTILVFMITLIYSFLIIRLVVDKTFPIGEFIPLLIYITIMGIAFYLGISLFAEEKNERTFEYLFSLRYSRWKIMVYKIMPRIGAVLFFLGLYALLSLIMKPFPIPAGWFTTIFLYLSLFFSSAAMSLLHRNHITNIVYALAIYMFIYG
ncbi:MAG: ABC transporter permease subunit, partial [Candidatus Aminicenantes bacterium]|nr:ABC transporter permease subunit [Candidatus Aminicenantes bacterium]